MFAFHDRVKSLMYSMFQGKKVIDIGPGKCTHRHELHYLFPRCVCIEKNPCFATDLANDNTINGGNIQILQADACEIGLHSSIQRLLISNENAVSSKKAASCFAFLSFQGVCDSEQHVRNFVRNLLPTVELYGYLIAILPQSKDIPNEGIRVVSTRSSSPTLFELKLSNQDSSWLGGKQVDFYSTVYGGEIYTEQLADDLSNSQNLLHRVMHEEGFALCRVLPLDVFHWWMANPQDHTSYDTMSSIERQISSFYRCVIWQKRADVNTFMTRSSTNDSSSILCAEAAASLEASNMKMFTSVPWDVLQYIFDFMDIVLHIRLAQTSKSMLRFYLLGGKQSFYSPEMIGSLYPMKSIFLHMYSFYSR